MPARPVYLDYNATTPCDPEVVKAMLPFFSENFGNASSRDHAYGWSADEAVAFSRKKVAGLVGGNTSDMFFTSGATEALNLALKSLMTSRKKHIITSPLEHEAVLNTCEYLQGEGLRVSYLNVDEDGNHDLEELENNIRPDTAAIVMMYANNETGNINPVAAIGRIAEKRGIPLICDATQAVGKIRVDVVKDHIDCLVFSSHKIYGPKGVGVLYMNKEFRKGMIPLIHGGQHEKGIRSGTLNVPGIVGFGKAAALAARYMDEEARRLEALRTILEQKLCALGGVRVNGNLQNRLPHVSNMGITGIEGENFVLSLAMDLAVSRGSACSGNVHSPSHVLRAMGRTPEEAGNSIRISLGRFTTEQEVIFAAETIAGRIRNRREKQLQGQPEV
ncbi:cysteine desulfurase [Sinomicrobium oceani]|uniref:cysteine desulfurase n=1 Tax=Sinomicrobium oceani TaxID=1150368 RepID=A0A1K1QJ91_9FLAO|nr:cysteine desulfurase family protein [Sinomicrobium oceani]SFW59837.1 cysteine desulfurase [Sinomicrobium oceani]